MLEVQEEEEEEEEEEEMYFTHISTLQLLIITCQLEWIDFNRKMLNKNYLGKVPSKAAKAEKWKDLKIRNFNT